MAKLSADSLEELHIQARKEKSSNQLKAFDCNGGTKKTLKQLFKGLVTNGGHMEYKGGAGGSSNNSHQSKDKPEKATADNDHDPPSGGGGAGKHKHKQSEGSKAKS